MQVHHRAGAGRARDTSRDAGSSPWSAHRRRHACRVRRASTARAGSSAPSETLVGVISQPSSVLHADVAGAAEGQAALEHRACRVRRLSESRAVAHRSFSIAFRKKSSAPKLPDFSASASGGSPSDRRRRDARIDLRPDAQRAHAERLHHRAGGFAAGHHQAAHAAFDQALRQSRRALLDQRAGALAAELRLRRLHRLRRRAGIDQDRPRLQAARSAQASASAIAASPRSARSSGSSIKAGCFARMRCDLRQRRRRAGAGQHRRRAADMRQSRFRRSRCQQAGAAEVARQADRGARAAGHQRRSAQAAPRSAQILVLDRIDDRIAMPLCAQLVERRADRRGALPHRRRSGTSPTAPWSGAPARARGWRRSSASADGCASRSPTAARRRRTGGRCRWCGRSRGTPGRRSSKSAPSSASSASATGPMLPWSVESKVEQYLK